jgi:NNP family nitrate/nitrite transporter-like MFS transporter
MGATYEKVFPGYGFGLALLVVVAAGALVFAYFGIKQRPRSTATV